MHVLVTIPADGATDVPLDQSIRVQFDRFLLPLAAIRQTACLYSVSSSFAESANVCDVFLEPTYDPVDRVAVFRPNVPLQPRLRYTMKLISPTGPGSFGIRAFDGAPLAKDYTFSFTTGDASTPSREPRRTIAYGGSCGVMQPLPNSPRSTFNACSLCHQKNSPVTFEGLSGTFLDLTDEGVRALVSPVVPIARETQSASNTPGPHRRDDDSFAVNMPYFDSQFSANSFLLYKMILALENQRPKAPSSIECDGGILDAAETGRTEEDSGARSAMGSGGPDAATEEDASPDGAPLVDASSSSCESSSNSAPPGLVDPFIPPDQWQEAAPGEFERLKTAIIGNPMSPPTIFPTSYEQAEAMSAWIAGGLLDLVGPCPSQ